MVALYSDMQTPSVTNVCCQWDCFTSLSTNVATKWPCHADQFCQYGQTNLTARASIMTVLPTLFADQQQNDLPLHEQLVRTLREAISGWGGHLPQPSGGQS